MSETKKSYLSRNRHFVRNCVYPTHVGSYFASPNLRTKIHKHLAEPDRAVVIYQYVHLFKLVSELVSFLKPEVDALTMENSAEELFELVSKNKNRLAIGIYKANQIILKRVHEFGNDVEESESIENAVIEELFLPIIHVVMPMVELLELEGYLPSDDKQTKEDIRLMFE